MNNKYQFLAMYAIAPSRLTYRNTSEHIPPVIQMRAVVMKIHRMVQVGRGNDR